MEEIFYLYFDGEKINKYKTNDLNEFKKFYDNFFLEKDNNLFNFKKNIIFIIKIENNFKYYSVVNDCFVSVNEYNQKPFYLFESNLSENEKIIVNEFLKKFN